MERSCECYEPCRCDGSRFQFPYVHDWFEWLQSCGSSARDHQLSESAAILRIAGPKCPTKTAFFGADVARGHTQDVILTGCTRYQTTNLESLSAHPEEAREDAKEAHKLAEQCGYYWGRWGRHEALRQLRAAARDLGDHADQKHWDEAEKLQPEIEEALRISREHDEEMARKYPPQD